MGPYGKRQFFKLWKEKFPEIKCRDDTMRCDICDEIETDITNTDNIEVKTRLKKKKKEHLEDVQRSRQFHDNCKLEAARNKSILLLGDGGDKFGLPRKKVLPKKHLIKTTLPVGTYFVDVYFGSLIKESYDYYYQDYNGITIECFHCTLEEYGQFKRKITGQESVCADNTSKEGKNFFLLGYLQSLVEQKLLKDKMFYNLLVGHTHFEADQSIGTDGNAFLSLPDYQLRGE